MKLLVFSAEWCQVCRALDRSGILTRFENEARGIRVVHHVLEDKSSRIIDRRGDTLFRKFDLRALPALVFTQHGKVRAKHEGGITFAALTALYERAK